MAPSTYPHHRHPRLPSYDYATPGFYFVTICTAHRLPLFGSVVDGVMYPNAAGTMVEQAWHDLASMHPGVNLDHGVILPDHLHAIIVLEDHPRRTLSLSDVIHRYKSLTTKRYSHGVREQDWPRFEGTLWQLSFHDRIIRGDAALANMRRYMDGNAQRWEVQLEG